MSVAVLLKGMPSVPGEDRIYVPGLTVQRKVSEACTLAIYRNYLSI